MDKIKKWNKVSCESCGETENLRYLIVNRQTDILCKACLWNETLLLECYNCDKSEQLYYVEQIDGVNKLCLFCIDKINQGEIK